MSEPASPVDVPKLAALLRAKRAHRGLREVANEIGDVSASTLSRLEQGNLPDLETFMRLCNWLKVSADDFKIKTDRVQETAEPSVPEFVEAHLRADRTLPPKMIDALSHMIKHAYDAAKHRKLRIKKG
ncbi:MAG: helix-turn-helix domain-containing protein [Candidatus Udaeobacter sp.]